MEETATVGTSGRAIVAVVLLEVMRVGVFAVVLGFLGCRRVLNCLALSPAAPPPEPVVKELGSFFADSLDTEIIRKAAISIRSM
jgi:hypothetical protein